VSAGRNELCACGSGASYDTCCQGRDLELESLVGELEATVQRLGEETWALDPDWCRARFAEIYDGGLDAFGPLGPDSAERLDAQLWFLLDCPLPHGQTPLWHMRLHKIGRSAELLARSELRAWRIESVDGAGVLGARCPLGTGPARLEGVRHPVGEPAPGAFVVARSVPLGPERWALLGRAPVVEPTAVRDFGALLASLDAPPGEFWRVHGGVLARAAWAWPEWREHTGDGEIVTRSLASIVLADPAAAIAALEEDPELEPAEADPDGSSRSWHWRWDPPARRAPMADAGVRFRVCDEDAGPRPRLALIDVDAGEPRLWVLAPTPARLALAERLLRDRLAASLGPVELRDFLAPSRIPRWLRARPESDELTDRRIRAA
jgi:SEC-C motif-containing protein